MDYCFVGKDWVYLGEYDNSYIDRYNKFTFQV